MTPDKLAFSARRQDICRRYLQGETQAEIAAAVSLSQGAVSRHLTALQADWLKSAALDFTAAKARQLAKIDNLEREAWAAYELSRQPEETR